MKFKFIHALVLAYCFSSTLWAKNKIITIELANQQKFHCEIANTPETLSRGLMYRDELAQNTGMLFVFPYPDVWPFWMKNTKIQLDMIWLDENRQVIYVVENAQPCQDKCPFYQPKQFNKASYVIELAGGQVQSQNIQIGNQLKFLEIVN